MHAQIQQLSLEHCCILETRKCCRVFLKNSNLEAVGGLWVWSKRLHTEASELDFSLDCLQPLSRLLRTSFCHSYPHLAEFSPVSNFIWVPPFVWRGLTQKLSSSVAEHKWKNTELYHTCICSPYFSNCWELRSVGEWTMVHWWHTVCVTPPWSASWRLQGHHGQHQRRVKTSVTFCSSHSCYPLVLPCHSTGSMSWRLPPTPTHADLPQPPPFQDPR